MLLVYATVFTCAIVLAALVRRYDLYGREPWYMVVLAVLLGAATMFGVGALENAVLARLRLDPEDYAAKAGVVASIEELAKLLVVAAIAALFRRRFRSTFDGLMYGTFAGLGMGIEESLLYLQLSPPTAQTLGAEVVRLFAHSLMGGVIGFAFGLFLRPPALLEGERPAIRRPFLAGSCAAVAGLVHFAWDYIAYQPYHGFSLRGILMFLMLALMLLWGAMVAFAVERSRPASPREFRRAESGSASPFPRRAATRPL